MPTSEANAYETLSRRLQSGRQALHSQFLRERPADFLEQNARLLDDYFRDSFESSMVGPRMGINKNPYAIVALGGYGRGEQCVHSDVDVLFLFKKEIPERAEALIQEMIFPLWDIGLDIGHAVRTLKDCIRLSGQDYEVLTSLLDARFLCGMSPLFSDMVNALREKVVYRRAHKIVDWLVAANEERHRLFGDSAYLLEPNLKEGQGGLRDYHTMLWLGQIKFGLKQPRDFEFQGYLSHEEFQELHAALRFIWNVRSGLHLRVGRKYDQLHFEHQVGLAETFGYNDPDPDREVERFLGDLHGHMERIKQHHLLFLHEMRRAKKGGKKRKEAPPETSVEGLLVRKDALTFDAPETLIDRPVLLVRIFEESARLGLPLDAEARRLVREFAHLVDERRRRDPEVVAAFERILLRPSPDAFNVLNEMVTTGFFIRLLPELAGVVDRIEYDTYHVYPVDRHLLRTVRTIKQFGTSEDSSGDDLCGALYAELENRLPLLWAALLHDVGKNQPGADHARQGAAVAREMLTERGYPEADVDTVAFLVREHPFLGHMATRRDVEDEETLLACARKIETPERLRMLYLLTVGDRIATGPKAWTEWTAILLRDLFLKTLRILERGDLNGRQVVAATERKIDEVLNGKRTDPASREAMKALFRLMSPRYLVYTPAWEIRRHIALFQRMEDRPFVWDVERHDETDARTVRLCAPDVPGAFSRIAGVLALNRIEVLDAQVHGWRNNIAIFVLRVSPPPDPLFEEERWARAGRELQSALEGKLDIAQSMEERFDPEPGDDTPAARRMETRVNVDNTSSRFFSIVEVFTPDAPGLLFRLTDALYRCRLDIWSAQIATTAHQVVDVFYVRDFDGRKLDAPGQVERLTAAIKAVLPAETGAESEAPVSRQMAQ
ncbi:MAG: [protein-PII] uridylyltransferase [Desulfococcaceae bacterium]